MLYELEFTVGGVSCMLVDLQPDNRELRRQGKYYEHYHPCFELHYIEKGEATYLCGKKTVAVKGGNLLVIPPRMYHKEISPSDENAKMTLSLDIKLPDKNAESNDFDFYNSFSRDGTTLIFVNNGLLKEKILQIKRLALSNDAAYITREKMRALAHEFTVYLYEQLTKSAAKNTSPHRDTTISREYEIDTFIAINFMSKSSRDALAEKLHVSPRQLHRIIKKSYGKSYREKLSEIRLEIALSFLETTDKSISEIAEELGYSSNASFTTFIKNSTGKTPSEIRRSKN